ncbi:MAG TPA: histidinol dehydrogenase [Acidobacteriota bacterium]|nr:histidinol dehydrogenase [Acidobacteriota bacterium]
MKRFDWESLSGQEIRSLCSRNILLDPEMVSLCRQIFDQVRARGDDALREYTEKFDGVRLDDFRVTGDEMRRANQGLTPQQAQALQDAASNIRTFHASQQVSEKVVEVGRGITCWRASRAISSVGLYVPAGTAPLPSTVLMLGIPAKLAGCARIILAVPPRKDGTVAPEVLAAAHLIGLRQVFKVGGAQAIAALALGTETIPRVDKILGPGSRLVQTAKLTATFYGSWIDMVAGPTEVLIIADESAPADVVAADLISQAEHGGDSQCVLVTSSSKLADEASREVEKQLETLPRRDLARQALEKSFLLTTPSLEEAVQFSNQYAPEHLILNVKNAREWLSRVESAGSVFVGPWSPETAGDYASGPNHTLPTSGLARCISGVSIDSFVKKITFQELSAEGLRSLAPTLEAMASMEGLAGHDRAVKRRISRAAEMEGESE